MLPNPSPQHASKIPEAIMEENNAVSVLENLIETCKDGQKGYQEAASHVKRSDLKTYFNEQSLARARTTRGAAAAGPGGEPPPPPARRAQPNVFSPAPPGLPRADSRGRLSPHNR